ncbi:unnamed protein product, partial [Didymodactylos carnosus]
CLSGMLVFQVQAILNFFLRVRPVSNTRCFVSLRNTYLQTFAEDSFDS